MDDERHERGDAFLGYHLRGLEEHLKAVDTLTRRQLEEVTRRLMRIEQKVDALASGMTPAEISNTVATLTAEAARITTVAEQTTVLADKLKQTGV